MSKPSQLAKALRTSACWKALSAYSASSKVIETLRNAVRDAWNQADEAGGVEAAAGVGANRDIGAQLQARGVDEQLTQLPRRLVYIASDGARHPRPETASPSSGAASPEPGFLVSVRGR